MGIDSDNDGLRDDIQRYIYLTYPGQPNVRSALRQYALTLQKTVDPNRVADEKGLAMECVNYFMRDEIYDVTQRLKAEVINTYARKKKYLTYDKELSGGVFSLSNLPFDESYKLCNFEIESTR